jgi:hypothetical protein
MMGAQFPFFITIQVVYRHFIEKFALFTPAMTHFPRVTPVIPLFIPANHRIAIWSFIAS